MSDFIPLNKVLFVCCNGPCRRDKEAEVIKAIAAKGNEFVKHSPFIFSEYVNFKKTRVEVNRTYFVVQERLEENVRGRMFNKVVTCKEIKLTMREEAVIARRLK